MADPLTCMLNSFEQPFRELAAELARRHPEAHFSVQSVESGALTANKQHSLFLSCSWPGRGRDEPDEVVLEVQLCHLTATPQVNADVCWSPGPFEAEFACDWKSSDDWPEATPEVLNQLYAKMPELMNTFRRAVARGRPVREDSTQPKAGHEYP